MREMEVDRGRERILNEKRNEAGRQSKKNGERERKEGRNEEKERKKNIEKKISLLNASGDMRERERERNRDGVIKREKAIEKVRV